MVPHKHMEVLVYCPLWEATDQRFLRIFWVCLLVDGDGAVDGNGWDREVGVGPAKQKWIPGKRAINHYQEIRSVQKQFDHENVEIFPNFFSLVVVISIFSFSGKFNLFWGQFKAVVKLLQFVLFPAENNSFR